MALLRVHPGLHAAAADRRADRKGPWAEHGAVPAVFMDRDGVLVEDVHFLTDITRLRVLPGTVEGLRLLQDKFATIVVTNQSGVARGYLTEQTLLEIHEELVHRLGRVDAVIDAIYYCPHHPEAPLAQYRTACDCRKPAAGMILRAARELNLDLGRSFVVGDSLRDVEAGKAAHIPGILVDANGMKPPAAYPTVRDLEGAAHWALARQNPPRDDLTP